MNTQVLSAVFKRNFVGYFASPTGYLFICIFVLLSAIAAFWPNEFFSANLANLDQLNKVFPFIMLVFIPAITMSIWADERRQGTDELLLTIPASDWDIVLGKYLAAVAIYSVSLVFSFLCNFAVLWTLGPPDFGLFFGTYVGYWLIGLAMLAIGMVASFLTGNLTVAYVLGALLNTPLVFASYADTIISQRTLTLAIKEFSVGQQFSDFSRGILTFSGLLYFALIAAVMLYLCMILIGRRHWVRGHDRFALAGHYLTRVVALLVIVASANVLFARHDVRLDVTSSQLSSLSPYTKKLLKELTPERPVQIDAYISSEVPESYVQTRIDLLNMLQELQARGNGKVKVRITPTDYNSDAATQAEQLYGITSHRVVTQERGAMAENRIFLGVAVNSGLQKVVLPFIDRGLSVEYELVRSVATVTQQQRKRVGILNTDAQLYGRFNFQTMSSGSNWPIIDELEKQYEVVQVDASKPITEKYDVLLAVQPSSLGPEQMDNFVAAVKNGQPTAIFEDPFPVFAQGVPATSAPRMPPGGMNPMMMQQQQQPKGDISKLWALLGVDFSAEQIIYQDYNPYPKLSQLPKEFVFVDSREWGTEAGKTGCEAFDPTDAISSKLQHILFPFPGFVSKLNTSALEFTRLVRTGTRTGVVNFRDMMQMSPFGPMGGLNPNRRLVPQNTSYALAAHIQGKVAAEAPKPEAKEGEAKPAEASTLNVVVIADIDMLHEEFFRLREQGNVPEAGIQFDFDNVTFVLNALDTLAGDDRFVEIRKRRPEHRTLGTIDKQTDEARKQTASAREELLKKYEKAADEANQQLENKVKELETSLKENRANTQDILIQVGMAKRDEQRKLDTRLEQEKKKRDKEIERIEKELGDKVDGVCKGYKLGAVLLPPILPLCLALGVFFVRRSREHEGVSRSRLRS